MASPECVAFVYCFAFGCVCLRSQSMNIIDAALQLSKGIDFLRLVVKRKNKIQNEISALLCTAQRAASLVSNLLARAPSITSTNIAREAGASNGDVYSVARAATRNRNS